MYTMALIDRDISLCEQIISCLKHDRIMRVIGMGNDGNEGLALIRTTKPAIVVIDPILEYVDGYSILRSIKELSDYHPIIYVLQQYNSNTVNRIMGEFEVDFISIKPISAQNVIDNLHDIIGAVQSEKAKRDVARPKQTHAIETHVLNVLTADLGLKQNKSCLQLRDVIVETMHSDSIVFNLNCNVYPVIAQRYNATVISVEKNLRDAIKRILSYSKPICFELFGERKAISNKEFLKVFVCFMKDYLNHLENSQEERVNIKSSLGF